MTDEPKKNEHHWSGWPGAFCLHCGKPDLWEIAIGQGLYDPYHEIWVEGDLSDEIKQLITEDECPVKYSVNCGQCMHGATSAKEKK